MPKPTASQDKATKPTGSPFDATAFLNTKTSEAYDTQLVLVPRGEYASVIQPFDKDSIRNIVGDDDTVYCVLDVEVEINDPEVLRITGRKKCTARGSVFLDVIRDGSGRIISLEEGKGKNVQLGQLREAVGQNAKGKAWSLSQMAGQMVFATVDHTITKKGRTVANVVSFRKAEGRPVGVTQ